VSHIEREKRGKGRGEKCCSSWGSPVGGRQNRGSSQVFRGPNWELDALKKEKRLTNKQLSRGGQGPERGLKPRRPWGGGEKASEKREGKMFPEMFEGQNST